MISKDLRRNQFFVFVMFALMTARPALANNTTAATPTKSKIFVVSSYHREYLWSQSTQDGLTAAMLKFGYLDSAKQAKEFTAFDQITSSKAIIKKDWMDTKRKYSNVELAQATQRIMKALHDFKPDIVFLGDDNAANYIGNQLLDTQTPAVFWGINGLPVKYGLVDSLERPGHNVTGVWQSGYHKESLEFLTKLAPKTKTFAVIASDSETTRPKIKEIKELVREGRSPLKLIGTLATNRFSEFKQRTLELAKKVDAFFVLNHDTLKDDHGTHIDMLVAGKWYLENVRKPEASHEDQFVREGMLSTANDSGYNQSYMAFQMALEILERGAKPGAMKPRTPPRGPLMANRQRARMLGISLEDKKHLIEEVIDSALALK